MFVKSTVSAGLLVALANFASASPVLLKREAAAAVAPNFLLTPAPLTSSDGSNLGLVSQDNFIWTHEDQGV